MFGDRTKRFGGDDSKRYEGGWKDGVREGKGTFYFQDGFTLHGTFKNNILEGEGQMTRPDYWRYILHNFLTGTKFIVFQTEKGVFK